ncbi:uncharacterized protein LOC123298336 [Chrysoperla carnea]|uniref:uncharacterized protein LOC123298336 n=1 Tax=Chrysoperla carnea TaxID=189513 RepID=UPI001D073B3D|nr:uncharacterized protein LOC123298336 [Chrysoperla carnea]
MNTPTKRRKSLAEREKYIAFFETCLFQRHPKLLREIKSLYDISNGKIKNKSDLNISNSVIKTQKQSNDHLLADISRPSTSYNMPSTSDEVIDLYSEETVSNVYEPRDYACIENKVSEISPSKKVKPVEFTNEINVSKNFFASPTKKQQKPIDSQVQRNSSEMAFFRAEIDPRKLQSINQLNRPGSSKETGVSFAKTQHSTAPKKYWIQVGNLDESVSEKDMLRHLHSKFPLYNDFVCKELKTTGSYSAFKVGVNEELKHEISLPNYWPPNAIIKDITAQFGNN